MFNHEPLLEESSCNDPLPRRVLAVSAVNRISQEDHNRARKLSEILVTMTRSEILHLWPNESEYHDLCERLNDHLYRPLEDTNPPFHGMGD